MNCAESQDLLLDLAYGELPPARAAEVQAHMLDCPSCRVEKAQLDDARKAAAPLRDLEEPPAGFDEPILRAARAEAMRTSCAGARRPTERRARSWKSRPASNRSDCRRRAWIPMRGCAAGQSGRGRIGGAGQPWSARSQRRPGSRSW